MVNPQVERMPLRCFLHRKRGRIYHCHSGRDRLLMVKKEKAKSTETCHHRKGAGIVWVGRQ